MKRIAKLQPMLTYTNVLLLPIVLCSLFCLSSCGGYGSSFACRDASGLNCMPLSLVDQKINSGEIVEVELKERGKCKDRNCYTKVQKPDIKPHQFYKVKLQQETEQRVLKKDNSLYIK